MHTVDAFTVDGNFFMDFVSGIAAMIYNCRNGSVANNQFYFDSVIDLATALRLYGEDISVVGNTMRAGTVGSTTLMNGFEFGDPSAAVDTKRLTVQSNALDVRVGGGSYDRYGMQFIRVLNSNVLGNTIKMDGAASTGNRYGMHFNGNCADNDATGNVIDMINSNALDVGICLATGSSNNRIATQTIENAGTRVRDNGTGNIIGVDGGST